MAADIYDGMKDRWPVNHQPIDNPRLAFAVTADDNKDLPSSSATPSYAKALFVGGAGDVKVTMAGDKTVPDTPFVFKNVPNGTTLNIQVRRVWSTGTTASAIAALCD